MLLGNVFTGFYQLDSGYDFMHLYKEELYLTNGGSDRGNITTEEQSW
jgi:hypothetical protein